MIGSYADRLAEHGSRLYLSGVDSTVIEQFGRVGLDAATPNLEVFEATSALGESSEQAVAAAQAWLDDAPQ